MPNLREDHKKGCRGPSPRSENSMPRRLKLNFGIIEMYMQILMLLSQNAQVSCLSTTLVAPAIELKCKVPFIESSQLISPKQAFSSLLVISSF